MGVLGAGLGLELAGLAGVIVLAVAALDKAPGGGGGLVGQAQGVGTHIGDQTHGALPGDVNALVELLGDGHGAAGGHVQLAAGLLLEGGGGEGRSRVAGLVGPLHRGDGKGGTLNCVAHRGDFLLAAQVHLLLFSVELGGEGARVGADSVQPGGQSPVLFGGEGANLLLPLGHQAGGHRLDPSGGQAPANLLPQQRGELVAHDAVQHPARLLGVHQVHVQLPGMGDGLIDHLLGDLVEGDPVGLVVGQAEQLLQMPGNGFALPVRVGGQIDGFALLGRLLQIADDVLFALDGLVVGQEALLHIHADLALGQVPDVAHGGLHLKPGAQIFSDGLGLGRRLHDDQIGFCHIFLRH